MVKRPLKPLGIGLLLALGTYGISVFLPRAVVLDLHACMLTGIVAIYVGFAIADGSQSFITLESMVALVFLGLAVSGLYYSLWIMIGGWVAHAIWDFLHHSVAIPGDYAGWYIPLCLSFDLGVAVYLIRFI